MDWCKQSACVNVSGPIHVWLATKAARWGADQELEACCGFIGCEHSVAWSDKLRTTRRPKPSLKEQALALLDKNKTRFAVAEEDVIRRALEALPND